MIIETTTAEISWKIIAVALRLEYVWRYDIINPNHSPKLVDDVVLDIQPAVTASQERDVLKCNKRIILRQRFEAYIAR